MILTIVYRYQFTSVEYLKLTWDSQSACSFSGIPRPGVIERDCGRLSRLQNCEISKPLCGPAEDGVVLDFLLGFKNHKNHPSGCWFHQVLKKSLPGWRTLGCPVS